MSIFWKLNAVQIIRKKLSTTLPFSGQKLWRPWMSWGCLLFLLLPLLLLVWQQNLWPILVTWFSIKHLVWLITGILVLLGLLYVWHTTHQQVTSSEKFPFIN